jgi:hypothetical protein
MVTFFPLTHTSFFPGLFRSTPASTLPTAMSRARLPKN